MKISITRALGELKLLANRIQTGTLEIKSLDLTQKKFPNVALTSNKTIEQFEKDAKSKYQSVVDMIQHRDNIKMAIVKSNATTMVIVGAEEMTVAAAVEKKTSIHYKEELLRLLRGQQADYASRVAQERIKLDTQLNNLITQNTGKDRKVDKDDFEKIAAPFIENNRIDLLDPLKVADKIDLLTKEITAFKADVDIVLSESNSKTMIDV
jgi:hypothetical protein